MSSSLQKFQCSQCRKKFVHQKSYISHLKFHKGAFTCKVCGKGFSNTANLNVHSRIHSGFEPFECEQCSEKFRTSSILKRHIQNNHQEVKVPVQTYKCPNCDKELKSLESYEKHLARHDIRNLHLCSICQTDCYTHEAWQAHQKRCHSGEKGDTIQQKLKKNTCHICQASFLTTSALWSHVTLTHIPFEGIPCPECGKMTHSRPAYLSHRRSHTQKKHLRCHVCKKMFLKKSHLRDHLRIHTKEYNYNCQVCSKGFLKSAALNTHLLAKHRPTVDTCSKRTLQRRELAFKLDESKTEQPEQPSPTEEVELVEEQVEKKFVPSLYILP